MSVRVAFAALLSSAALALVGCTSPPAESTPEPPASVQTPDATATDSVVGQWRDAEVDWTVHLNADGTFVEDFEGHTEFRSGTWTLTNGVLSLEGGDGNTDNGTVKGEAIEFRLGTLVRVED